MLKYAAVYLAVLLTFVLVDVLWLRVIAVSWYQQGMGSLLAESPNFFAAALFYLVYPVGLLIFAVLSAEAPAGVWRVAGLGMLFGFFAYATYDLTNLAVIKGWPMGLSFIDIAWGSCLSAIASVAGKVSLDYLNR
jgi:uncharacterized membrane protein